jgi:hypothetical protein
MKYTLLLALLLVGCGEATWPVYEQDLVEAKHRCSTSMGLRHIVVNYVSHRGTRQIIATCTDGTTMKFSYLSKEQ